MTFVVQSRLSDSSSVETVMHGHTIASGAPIRPAETHWHLVISRHSGKTHVLLVGPLTKSGVVQYGAGAEILWIKFRLGVYMPHLPTRNFLETETLLPEAVGKSFWLKGSAWPLPNHENADTFINRLMREDVLAHDPVVSAVLCRQVKPQAFSPRTVRHRFLHTTGLTQGYILQYERARQAQALLESGASILDTVEAAGYYDQPHLTRALRQFVGYTPAQIIRMRQTE
jgi:hypothetical protein